MGSLVGCWLIKLSEICHQELFFPWLFIIFVVVDKLFLHNRQKHYLLLIAIYCSLAFHKICCWKQMIFLLLDEYCYTEAINWEDLYRASLKVTAQCWALTHYLKLIHFLVVLDSGGEIFISESPPPQKKNPYIWYRVSQKKLCIVISLLQDMIFD